MCALNEYEVHCSKSETDENRISCETWSYIVDAESEEDAEQIIRKQDPGATIGRITLRDKD